MTDQDGGVGKAPVQILRANSSVTSGLEVSERLIAAASAFADLLRPTYGPKGLDKMLYKTSGQTAITNDGAKIVSELMVKHPSAKIFVSLGQAQESFAGDGVTGCLLFAGALMHEAGLLLGRGMHPLQLIEGYTSALEVSLTTISEHTRPCSDDDLSSIARTSMTGKLTTDNSETLAALVVDAILLVRRKEDDGIRCSSEDVLMSRSGTGSSSGSRLIRGMVLEQRLETDRLPQHLEDVRVIVLDSKLDFRELKRDAEIEIEQPDQLTAFIEEEDRQIDAISELLISTGVSAVFSTGDVHRDVLHSLATAGVFVLGGLDRIDADRLCRVCGATLLNRVEDVEDSQFGRVGSMIIQRDQHEGEARERIIIDDCVWSEMATIEVGGSTLLEAEESIRAIHDALKSTALATRSGTLIPGGGFPHAAAAAAVRAASVQQSGRPRLGMEAFARALETIPASLASNAGRDSLDAVLELRAGLRTGQSMLGVNAEGEVEGMSGVFEPAAALEHALASATETVITLLRVDQLISARGD